ncbi:MAG: SWIM zinc finger family protein [Chloroflexi bacterium]|nr:SWIM zinc finger family protein [Chloroflexota bacterium]
MSHDNAWWERHGPGLPSHGIRAHTQRGQFGKTWWTTRWIAALERLVNPGRLARGRNYARTGHVLSLDIERGKVTAVVQGSRPAPYTVSINFRTLDDSEWERVIEHMSSQALYAARLLSGEMPEDIEDVFAAVGSSLFPKSAQDMQTRCSCPDWANPCKHIAAVHYLLGERFDEDPFLMFLLRGRSQDEIVAALRARRSGTAPAEAEEADVPTPPPDPAKFWTAPAQTNEVALHFALPETDALRTKRLGPLPFVRDQEALTAALEKMYQHIGEYALLLALGDTEIATSLEREQPRR